MEKFKELGLEGEILKGIEDLGFEVPSPVQEKVIPVILGEENDLVVLAQTGTGKTAAFGLPLIQKLNTSRNEIQVLILSPTRELCVQIGFHPRITEQFDLYENLLQAVEAGTGISILPYRSRSYMHANNLAFTLLDGSNDTLDLAIAWEHEITNPTVPLFLEVFRKYMQEHPEYF